jgi:hypothetical protein
MLQHYIQAVIRSIEKLGWTQYTFQDGKGRACLIGHIRKAVDRTEIRTEIYKAINSKLLKPSSPYHTTNMIGWNDTPGRTQKEVIDMLKSLM